MLWAACCLGFFGFLRAGEFTVTSLTAGYPLSVDDVAVDSRVNPQVLLVHIRRSKTNPYGAGIRIFLGRTGDTNLCPVAAVLQYLAIRPSTPGPLFVFQTGCPLTRPLLVRHVRQALLQAGINVSKYSGHSFRIGAATTAAKAGLRDSLIQVLGRWKSSAFTAYIRTPVDELIAVTPRLARPS